MLKTGRILPDSTTNESESHGFVKFTIRPLPETTNGTIINNTAHIYFDYNPPISTNNPWIVISDSIPQGDPIIPLDIKQAEPNYNKLIVYPNPTKGDLQVVIPNYTEINNCKVIIYDITGNTVNVPYSFDGKTINIRTQTLNSGIYILEIRTGNAIIGRSKIIKQ